jgi:hypothetical protein
MQGWHSQRLLGSGEVTEPIVKEKGLNSTPKQKNLKNIGNIPKRWLLFSTTYRMIT